MIRRLLSHQLLRYILVGGTAFVIEIALIILMTAVLTISPVLSVAIAFWFGLSITFIMQKLLTFQNTEHTAKKVGFQATTYLLLVAINYGFTLFFVWLFEPLIGVVIARSIALVITTTWNYVLYSKVIFKKK